MTKPERSLGPHNSLEAGRDGLNVESIPGLPAADAKRIVKLMKLLSDVTRLRIVHILHPDRELNVGDLCRVVDQSQPAVSHHLALLRKSGVLERRRDGKHNFYRLKRASYGELVDMLASGAR